MGERNFRKLLEARWDEREFVCVGLDSDDEELSASVFGKFPNPYSAVLQFNKRIVNATSDLVCAYKPNFAFYVKIGVDGLRTLQDTISYIHYVVPGVPVIIDTKDADIGNTNRGYVKMLGLMGADAVTVNPYLGEEAVKPFLNETDMGVPLG